ncbi:MAG: hypothetical protein ACREV7_23130 [Steroidobacteraceae bacterium]
MKWGIAITEKVSLSHRKCGIEDEPDKPETISRVQRFELVVAGMPDAKKAGERRAPGMKGVDVRRGHRVDLAFPFHDIVGVKDFCKTSREQPRSGGRWR